VDDADNTTIDGKLLLPECTRAFFFHTFPLLLRRLPKMSNFFESGELMSVPVKSPLIEKSLTQIKYYRGYYQSQLWSANLKGRKVLRFQVKKLDKLRLAFQSQNKSVA
jgi:hypothetical protein